MPSNVMQLQFSAGVDEGTDPKQCPPGTLLVGENVRMDLAGRLGKRFGTKALAKTIGFGGATLAAALRLGARGPATTVFDGTSARDYAAPWTVGDHAPNMVATWRGLVGVPNVQVCDAALYGDLVVCAYHVGSSATTNGTIYVQVTHRVTGAQVMAPTSLTGVTAIYPRVVIRGTTALVFYALPGSTTLAAQEVNLTTMALGTLRTVSAFASNLGVYDVIVQGTDVVVAYLNTTPQVVAARITSSWVTAASVTVASVAATTVAVYSTAGEICWVMWSDPAGTKLWAGDPTTLAATSTQTINAAASARVTLVRWDATHVMTVRQTNKILYHQVWSTSASLAAALQVVNVAIASKPWVVGGRGYMAVTTMATINVATATGAIEPSHAVIELDTITPAIPSAPSRAMRVAQFEPHTADYQDGNTGQFVTAATTAPDGSVVFAIPYRVRQPVSYETPPKAYQLATIQAAAVTNDALRAVSMGENGAFCSGGSPFCWDGVTCAPSGFIAEPYIESATASTTGGVIQAGTYLYSAVYEWYDANGILHRSAPSVPVRVTTTGTTSSVALVITTTGMDVRLNDSSLQAMNSPVQIALYRTTAGGSTYYRLTHEPGYNVIANDPTVRTVSFTDTRNDTDVTGAGNPSIPLATQPQIYTSGGILEDDPPPGALSVLSHRTRLWVLAGDMRSVRASKDQSSDPLVAPAFNFALQVFFDRDKLALAALDENVVALGPESIDLIVGEGSPSTGEPFGWATRRIQTDQGCIAARSVVSMPGGVMFQSRRGIELLGRDLTVSWVGRPVQQSLAAYPVVTSAVLVPDQHVIRFTCCKSDLSASIVLVFDYVNGAWLTAKYSDPASGGGFGVAIADAALVNGVWTFTTFGGQVYQEDPTTFLDYGTTWVTRDVQIAWLSPTGKLSWQRVRGYEILATSMTDHDLEVSLAHDYSATWEKVLTFLATTPSTSVGPRKRARVNHLVQKIQATRVRIRDLTPSFGTLGIGQGPIWEGFGLDVKGKSGMPKTASTEQG